MTGTSADYTTHAGWALYSIPCKFEGKPGNYLAKIWQDRDWGVERGPTLGYTPNSTEVHINRFPGRLRKLYAPHVGSKIKGVVRQNGDDPISGWIELTEKVVYPQDEYTRFAMADWDYEIVDAYYFEIGFSTSGWRVLKDLKKK